jgi:hypothetical protein
MKLTTISQFGARLSLAKLHIRRLLRGCKKNNECINHIFYLVDPSNIRLHSYLIEVYKENSNITLYTREDNDFTPFSRLKKKAPVGGDCNYDFLIRRSEVGDLFLTMHDDTLIQTNSLYEEVMALISEADFAGYCDTRREITGYQNILFEGVPMSDLRLGTWFTLGRRDIYLAKDFKIGDYRSYWKYHLWARYGFDRRLRFLSKKIWLNGGFDLNINARIQNFRFNVRPYNPEVVEHYEKITGFFAATKRQLLGYADTDEEISRWQEYFNKLKSVGDKKQIEHDIEFLLKLAEKFEHEDIYDQFLNSRTIISLRP